MRVRRSLWNFLSTLLMTAVTMLVGLKASPLLDAWLGSGPFGAVRTMTDATGLLALLELGLSGAIGPLLARAIGVQDEDRIRKAVVAGFRGYVRVSLTIIVVGLCITPVVAYFADDLTPAERLDLKIAWIVGLGVFLPMALLPFRSVLEAEQRSYIINLLLIIQSLVMTALALTLAKWEWGITGQSIALVVAVWVFNLLVATIVLRGHPGLLKTCLTEKVDLDTRKAMRGLSAPVLIVNLCGRLGLLTDNLVIAQGLGEKRVASLFFTQRLAVIGQNVLQGIGNSTWAALAELHAKGDFGKFNRRLIELSRLTAILAVVGLGPVIAYNHAFFRLWAHHGEVYEGDFVIAVASVNVFLVAIQSLWCWCFTATGEVRRVVPATIAAATLNLVVSIILVRKVGVAGPLLGTLLGMGGILFWALLFQLKATYGTSIRQLIAAIAPAFVWGIVSSSFFWWATRHHEPESWFLLAFEMSAAALFSLGVCISVLISKDERAVWRWRLTPTRFQRVRSA